MSERFDFRQNIDRVSQYGQDTNLIWPPYDSCLLHTLDIASKAPHLPANFYDGLANLRRLIEGEWLISKSSGGKARQWQISSAEIENVLLHLGSMIPNADDKRALEIRTQGSCQGYTPSGLEELVTLRERNTIVAGHISTWYGKEVRSRPTAFACNRDDKSNTYITRTAPTIPVLSSYVQTLDQGLYIAPAPEFDSTNVFFMAGEGNRHPKHIAYFLPEDEGIKRSPYKRTYYFNNTHQALFSKIATPLYRRLCGVDAASLPSSDSPILPLWVRGHDLGHFVRREETAFSTVNTSSRWASVVLQEVSADVFGTLFVCDVWSYEFGYSKAESVAYYVAELFRFIARGLGFFPDSDGMYIQLRYLIENGFITVDEDSSRDSIRWKPEAVIDGLRHLARELSGTLLANDSSSGLALMAKYGPTEATGLPSFIRQLSQTPACSIEYTQDYRSLQT